MSAPERVQSHGPDWSDSLPGEPPSCVCGFNGTPEECAAWRSADGAPDAAGIEAALAAGLAAHRLTWRTSTLAVCTCGQWSGYDVAQGKLDAPVRRAHDAHQAAALLPVVTQAQAEALREAADAMGRAARDGGSHWRAHAWANWLRARADKSGAR